METSKGIEQAEVMRRWHEQQALPKSERDILEFKHFNDTTDDCLRDQLSRGQPPLVALHNAAQAYADSLRKRPDCSQYADETKAWGEQQDSDAVELLREGDRLMASRTTWTSAEMLWHDRVRNFLEGKHG